MNHHPGFDFRRGYDIDVTRDAVRESAATAPRAAATDAGDRLPTAPAPRRSPPPDDAPTSAPVEGLR